jgi:shikimate kinase
VHVHRSPVRAVFLIGFMGAGKSAVGAVLGQKLDWRFEDLDARIEAQAGRTIAEIFRESGETRFRELEHDALRKLLAEVGTREGMVVALGGGAFAQRQNAALLASEETPTVFLNARVEELWQRCSKSGEAERPLRSDPAEFQALFARRLPLYLQARLHVETEGKSIEKLAEEVIERLGLRRNIGEKEK